MYGTLHLAQVFKVVIHSQSPCCFVLNILKISSKHAVLADLLPIVLEFFIVLSSSIMSCITHLTIPTTALLLSLDISIALSSALSLHLWCPDSCLLFFLLDLFISLFCRPCMLFKITDHLSQLEPWVAYKNISSCFVSKAYFLVQFFIALYKCDMTVLKSCNHKHNCYY